MYISMNMIEPLLAVIAGILVMIQPKSSHYILGIYLLVIGVLGLLPYI